MWLLTPYLTRFLIYWIMIMYQKQKKQKTHQDNSGLSVWVLKCKIYLGLVLVFRTYSDMRGRIG